MGLYFVTDLHVHLQTGDELKEKTAVTLHGIDWLVYLMIGGVEVTVSVLYVTSKAEIGMRFGKYEDNNIRLTSDYELSSGAL